MYYLKGHQEISTRREFLKSGSAGILLVSLSPLGLATKAEAFAWISMARVAAHLVTWWGGVMYGASKGGGVFSNNDVDVQVQINRTNQNLIKGKFTENKRYFEVDRLPGISAHKKKSTEAMCMGIGTETKHPAMIEAGSLLCLYDCLYKYNNKFDMGYLKSLTRPMDPGQMPDGDLFAGYSRPTEYATGNGDFFANWEVWHDGNLKKGRGHYTARDYKNRRTISGQTDEFLF